MISTWKQELIKRASELFARGNKALSINSDLHILGGTFERIEGSPVIDKGG
jgi:hypothetical protein